ncbi:MAG: LysR family transcriptional regulator [Sandaracinus sp.]
MNLAHVQAFVEVVRQKSFSGAARRLGLPTSSISRAIARLERDLSGKLFERTTRQVALTPLGQAFRDHATRALAELEEGERRVHELAREPRGEVRLSIPTDLDDGFFARTIARFTTDHPGIRVTCVIDNRYVDLIADGFDLALRVADDLPDSSLVARPLGTYRAWLVASPAYLARRGTPRRVADLARHDCVLTHGRDGVARWTLLGPRGPETVTVEGRAVAGDLHFARELVRAGAGIGIVALPPPDHVPPDASGLVRVLPEHELAAPKLFLVAPSTQRLPSRITLLREHVLRAYQAR